MARCRQLPDRIEFKLRSYYEFNMIKHRIIEKHSSFFKSLPVVVKREIVMNCYTRKIMRIPYFMDWPPRVTENLMNVLKEEIYLKNDVVSELGIQGHGMIIIDAGVMAVYTADHVEQGHLIDGDYFGELSLVTDRECRTSYVVAVTNCKVLILEKNVFRKFMREYPDLFFEMKQKIRDPYLANKSGKSNPVTNP
ncbi:hypothetical protein evm_005732 [Chilo suppressalis]|nr:hypothetical protein evm_005732 [Chilo suppressalis]